MYKLLQAVEMATIAHVGQIRKFSGLPYIVHPIEVGKILARFNMDEDVIIAGILHDTIEDTSITKKDIEKTFGSNVANLVKQVTKISIPSDGNREKRKALDAIHYACGSAEGQNIKLADIIANTRGVVTEDSAFAKMYIPEQQYLASKLLLSDNAIHREAIEIIAKEQILLNTINKRKEK